MTVVKERSVIKKENVDNSHSEKRTVNMVHSAGISGAIVSKKMSKLLKK